MTKFTADNSYISISWITGDKLRKAGVQIDTDGHFEDLRRVIVSAISNANVDEKTQELHYLVDLSLSDVPVVLHCIARYGSPAGNKPYTVTVFDVLSRQRYDEMKFYEQGINGFITKVKNGKTQINKNDIIALKARLRNISKRTDRYLDNEKAALRKIIGLLEPIYDGIETVLQEEN